MKLSRIARRIILKLVILQCLLFPLTSREQETTFDRTFSGWLVHLTKDPFASTYDFSKDQFRWEGPAIVLGTTASSLLLYHYNDVPFEPGTDVFGDEASKWISRMGQIIPYALPVGFFGSAWLFEDGSRERSKAFLVTEELAESLFFNFATTGILKLAVDRTRPNGEKYSFPSYHTSTAFAAAGIIAYNFPWYVGVLSFGAASAVGLARLDLNVHYASDVMAGAGIGFFLATSVFFNHQEEQLVSHLTPWMEPNTLGLRYLGRF